MRSQLRQSDWNAAWGKPQPLMDGPHAPSMWNARQGGAAVLARLGHPLRPVAPSSPASRELWDSGRWCHAEVAYGDGGRVLHLFSFYGFSGDGGTAVNSINDALLRQAIDTVAELGAVPVLLCGDFNILSSKSNVLMTATSTGQWIDVMAMFAALEGSTPPVTCFTRKDSPGSRLDYVLANVVAASALQRVGYSGTPPFRRISLSLLSWILLPALSRL